MAITYPIFHALYPYLVKEQPSASKVLFLGTQDLPFTYDDLSHFLDRNGFAYRSVAKGLRKTTNSFAWVAEEDWPKYSQFLHQSTLMEMLGYGKGEIVTLDSDPYEKADVIVDLNKPIAEAHLCGAFHKIFDIGTSEHV